jgi:hypothetical protein
MIVIVHFRLLLDAAALKAELNGQVANQVTSCSGSAKSA